MTREAIATDKLAAPVGPFSLGVRGAGLLFLSGQVAQDPATGKLIDGDVARQTHQILDNIATALETVGKSLADVLRVGVYLTDISDFAVMSQAYSEHFAEPYPARTAIGSPPCRWERPWRWTWSSAEPGLVLAVAIGSGAIAAARTTAARSPRTASCRRSGRRQG
jgi:2-iminobutanoate/2-iminopropanoate deaminase